MGEVPAHPPTYKVAKYEYEYAPAERAGTPPPLFLLYPYMYSVGKPLLPA